MTRKGHFACLWIGFALALTACVSEETPTPITIVKTVVVTLTPEATPLPIPFQAQWLASEHADENAPTFRHWDAEDPPEIPVECAKCHSGSGYLDYLGVDETVPDIVDQPAPVGSVIDCVTCHNEATLRMSSVSLPSGQTLDDLGAQARCILCHQARVAQNDLDALFARGNDEEDAIDEELEFIDIHAGAVTALRYGNQAQVAYEYDSKQYDSAFMHVEGYQACQDCHDPHNLKLKLEQCTECHQGVQTVNDLHQLRTIGSQIDYDGDKNLDEGIFDEIVGLKSKLLTAMQTYTLQISDTALGYQPAHSPHFFVDENSDGKISLDEARLDNRFQFWTPRLLKAAFNYHLIQSDAGAYAHGGKYAIQLLWDSIENLNEVLESPVELIAGERIDAGHFAGSKLAYRQWDQSEQVPADCSRCHSATGLPFLIQEGEPAPQPTSNGLLCTTCHNTPTTGSTIRTLPISFSPETNSSQPDEEISPCLGCHQSAELSISIQEMLSGEPPDLVNRSLEIDDLHPLPIGDTIFGGEARAGYQYADKTYIGRFAHPDTENNCASCHDAHTLVVHVERCADCHDLAAPHDLYSIGSSLLDFDGDGDTSEGMRGEIVTQLSDVYSAMQNYASDQDLPLIAYQDSTPPYFFEDSNANGKADDDETISRNRYTSWTPRLFEAAYNYHYVLQDKGRYAHNPRFLLQLLYDSIKDLDGDITGKIRP